jgi:hypothetical protein
VSAATPPAEPPAPRRPRRIKRAAAAAVVAALCALIASSVASATPLGRTDGHGGTSGTGGTGGTRAAVAGLVRHGVATPGGVRHGTEPAIARPGVKAPATRAVITGLAANGIPNVALNAYRVAAARMAHVQPSCGIDWALLAGIGREESDHGRFGGARLNRDGTSTPPIIGPALDGTHSQYIPAPPDGPALDGDATYTHALGPMQFIPQTWASYGADANGDGTADIFNINDAALGAARYLCASGGNLRTVAGQTRAILAYNDSDQYLAQVLALAAAYRAGVPVRGVPVGDVTGALPPVPATIPFAANPGPPTAASSSPLSAAGGAHGGTRPGATRHRTPVTPAASDSPAPGRTTAPRPRPSTHPAPSGATSSGTTRSPAAPTPSPTALLPTKLPTALPTKLPTKLPTTLPAGSSPAPKPTPSTQSCVLGVSGTCIVP